MHISRPSTKRPRKVIPIPIQKSNKSDRWGLSPNVPIFDRSERRKELKNRPLCIEEDIKAFNDPSDGPDAHIDPERNRQECWGYDLEEYYERCAKRNSIDFPKNGDPTENAILIHAHLKKKAWSATQIRDELINAAREELMETEHQIQELEAQDVVDLSRMAAMRAIPAATDSLIRYETALLRQFYQALHGLERHRAYRNGRAIPPPAALDVSVGIVPET